VEVMVEQVTFRCACCRRILRRNSRVKKQQYCGAKACQQARKNRWQREKQQTDVDYRVNKKESQHTGVSIAAETPNTGSATDNCNRQETKKGPRQQLTILQKKDTLSQYFNDTTTTYYIYAGGENLAKMDALSVKIIPITPG
jgi:hypothetical protein